MCKADIISSNSVYRSKLTRMAALESHRANSLKQILFEKKRPLLLIMSSSRATYRPGVKSSRHLVFMWSEWCLTLIYLSHHTSRLFCKVLCKTVCWCGETNILAMNTQQEPSLVSHVSKESIRWSDQQFSGLKEVVCTACRMKSYFVHSCR